MSDPLRSSDDRFAEENEDNYEGLFDSLPATDELKPRSWKDKYVGRKVSPRVRLAAKLYHSGIAKTIGEAAKMAGLHPSTLYAMNVSDNEEYKRISGQADKDRDIMTGDISAVLQRLGRNALSTIEDLRAKSESEGIRLKAAIDLADRSPETSKIQKVQVQSITLEGKDIEELTRSLVEAAEVQGRFAEVASGDYVKVTTESQEPQKSLPHPATNV